MNNTYDLNIAKYHDMLVRISSLKLIYFLSLYLVDFLWFPEKKILQNFYSICMVSKIWSVFRKCAHILDFKILFLDIWIWDKRCFRFEDYFQILNQDWMKNTGQNVGHLSNLKPKVIFNCQEWRFITT